MRVSVVEIIIGDIWPFYSVALNLRAGAITALNRTDNILERNDDGVFFTARVCVCVCARAVNRFEI